MKIEKIKSIPKNIIAEIKKRETVIDGRTRYYSYLTTNDKELVKITVAIKYKGKEMYIKQCAVHGLRSDKCFVKDMCFTYMAGYQVGWHYEGLTTHPKWYEDGEWGTVEDKYFDVFAPVLNLEFLAKYDEYKYSAYDIYPYTDILQYLRLYEEYPQAEYLVKFGLSYYVKNKQILKKIGTDKKFQKWLFNNGSELKGNLYYVSTIMKAYKENKPLNVVQAYEEKVKKINADKSLKPIRELFGKDIKKYIDYIEQKEISHRLYLDYLTACNYLGLDMSENKNRIPHDFMHWHDVRIEEYKTVKAFRDEEERKAKALKDAEERKELYEKFSKVAEKYSSLQYDKNDAYVIVIAKSPAELVNEGAILKHCVGHMEYDKKMAKEETLIFFVRTKENPTEPYVTVEYSIKSKKILQCYAKGNKTPDAEVTTYVNNLWMPYANKVLKKMVA
jgi:hypothetical protein